MSGTVLGAGIPFLGPAVAAWITLIVGVMAFYFLSVSREYRTRGAPMTPERRQPPSVEPRQANSPVGSRWVPQPDAVQLPSYDMENYPDEKWRTLVESTADSPQR